jgi:hypothetical protein
MPAKPGTFCLAHSLSTLQDGIKQCHRFQILSLGSSVPELRDLPWQRPLVLLEELLGPMGVQHTGLAPHELPVWRRKWHVAMPALHHGHVLAQDQPRSIWTCCAVLPSGAPPCRCHSYLCSALWPGLPLKTYMLCVTTRPSSSATSGQHVDTLARRGMAARSAVMSHMTWQCCAPVCQDGLIHGGTRSSC